MSRLGVGGFGPWHRAALYADGDRSAPALRYSEVSRVKDPLIHPEAQLLDPDLELGVLRGGEQLGDVLHHERLWLCLLECAQVLAPEASALEADGVAVERGEALAGRPAYHYVHRGKDGNVLDRHLAHVVAEVLAIGSSRIGVALDRENRAEPFAVEEAAGHPAAPGEEIDQLITAWV